MFYIFFCEDSSTVFWHSIVVSCTTIIHLKFNGWQNDRKMLKKIHFVVRLAMHDWVLIVPDGNNPGDAKKRKGKAVKEGQAEPDSQTQNGTKQLTFDLQCLKSVQTDFEKDGGFQKAVRFSPDHTLVVTGGADGFLRVWKVLLLHSLSIFLLAFSLIWRVQVRLLSHDWWLTTKRQSKYEQHFLCTCVIVLLEILIHHWTFTFLYWFLLGEAFWIEWNLL